MLAVGRAGVGVLLRKVWDRIWRGVLATEATDQRVVRLAGFGESVVAGVEVFALFELVLEKVLLVRELAVEAEELLFFFGESLRERWLAGSNLGMIMERSRRRRSPWSTRTLTSTLFFWCGFIFAVCVRSLPMCGVVVESGVASSRRRWA
jgi:hypothetical protein